MKKILKLGISLLAVIILITACGGKKAGDEGTLRIAQAESATSLNFLQTSSSLNYNVITNITEGLVQYDDNNKLIGALAESWDVSPDGKTYTFTLRDALWADGTPLTAGDFVYSLQTRLSDGKNVYRDYVAHLKNGKKIIDEGLPVTELGAKAPDDRTLILELEKAENYFLDMLIFPAFFPLNKIFFEEVGLENFGSTPETFLGNGPYVLSEFKPDFGWTYTKNKNYWDAENVAIETINVRVIAEAQTRNALWEQGELDIMPITGDDIQTYENSPEIFQATTPRTNYFYLSSTIEGDNNVLENKNFRAAIAHSIDKEVIADSILNNGSIAADGYIPVDVISVDGTDFREIAGNNDAKIYDQAKAQEYYKKAKEELHLGDTTEFELVVTDVEMTKLVYENVKSQIETTLPGVTVNMTTYPQSAYSARLYEHTTPAAISQFEPAYKDIEGYMYIFRTGVSQNFSQWSNEKYDELYKKAESPEYADNLKGRLEIYAEMEQLLLSDYTIIPIYQSGATYLVSDRVEGFKLHTTVPHIEYKTLRLR